MHYFTSNLHYTFSEGRFIWLELSILLHSLQSSGQFFSLLVNICFGLGIIKISSVLDLLQFIYVCNVYGIFALINFTWQSVFMWFRAPIHPLFILHTKEMSYFTSHVWNSHIFLSCSSCSTSKSRLFVNLIKFTLKHGDI